MSFVIVAEKHRIKRGEIIIACGAGNVFMMMRFEQQYNQQLIHGLRLLAVKLRPRVQSHGRLFVFHVLNSMGDTAMLQQIEQPGVQTQFQDRRRSDQGSESGRERRQFCDGKRSSRPEVVELADAVDDYKARNCRRFITFEELFDVMQSLGYHK
ncbi:MAG: hypothetical protein MK102_06355 [Fuerstiella sp.]|nr:hypothetical protein [Fuerstiella sp.]